MQPDTSPGSPSRRGASRTSDRAAKVRFRRALALMLMTLVLPGSAQLVAGRREIGKLALRVTAGVAGTALLAALLFWMWPGLALRFGTSPLWLNLLRFTLMLLAIGWAALFVDAWRIGQPLSLVRRQRLTMVGVNGALVFGVAGVLLFSAHLVTVHRDFMLTFADGPAKDATHGRYNVLLLGGDSGDDRWGLRTDSMTVASIDADTGRTVLVGLPRNLQNFRFADDSVMAEQFPDGFNCPDCYLNGVSTWAQDNPELFDSKDPGKEATIEAIEGITGLKIHYWAMADLQGFEDLVDAVGGIELNVRDRIPVGGLGSDVTGYIEPGVRKLNGHDALWFARAREGSDDYSRMARQKCVMGAMVSQLSPATLVQHYKDITEATTGVIDTNVPRSQFANFVELAMKAKDQKMSTVSLVPPAINTADPDLDKIRAMVQKGIDKAEGKTVKGAKKAKTSDVTSGGSLGTRNEGYAANEADDLSAAC
ncbi:LCP family protein [Nocardioides alcanivorans]|uniref:LCP family protein n=1 Tax=Nocardioides alcanivorans TaxID=2897352 RepID=UPI001F261557|nr:LCP family protein [Nocardioides alcanivorans]